MSIKLVDLDDLELSFIGDTEEPKTVFVVKPFTQFEYIKVAGIYYKSLESINEEDENKVIELFASEKGEELKKTLDWFFSDKVKEVKNIKDKENKLITLSVDKLSINMFDLITLMDIMSQTMGKIIPDEAEAKN